MKILVYGTGKTGTTALTYAIKNAFQTDEYKIVFEPSTLAALDYSETKMIVKSLQIQKLQFELQYINYFDKKIIILRHPFDTIISRYLYNPFNGNGFSNDFNTNKYIKLLKMKAELPDDIPLQEIINLHKKITKNKLLNSIFNDYKKILEIVQQKDFELYKLKYEDFVDGNLNDLGQYLGVDVKSEVKVDEKFKRVARSKKHSEWKNWFTEDDIKEISPIFADFIQILKYDTNLDKTEKVIEPATSYIYVINIINEYRKNYGLPEYKEGVINIGEEGTYIDEAIRCLNKNNLQSAEEAIVKAFELNPNLQATYNLIEKRLKKKLDITSRSLENLDNNTIRINNISILHPDNSNLIWKFFLDSPRKNETNQFETIKVKGWIVGKKTPAEKIQLIQDNQVTNETPVNIQRLGVVKFFPEVSWAENSGFETTLLRKQNNRASEITLRVVFQDETFVDLARIEVVQ